MAGHSKWNNTKHRKAKQDALKGKLYTKLIREITVAARANGGDPGANPRLRLALDKALTANMSRDVIDRAIKRGAGGIDDTDIEEIRYEGYAPGGVAIIVDSMTNNRNRTVAEVRHAFSKCGGSLGTTGSVGYLFQEQGQITLVAGANEERVMEIALEQGADDIIVNDDGTIDVTTPADKFLAVKSALTNAGFELDYAEASLFANLMVPITDKDTAEKITRLIDMLEELDDVQEVYSNADDYSPLPLAGEGQG